MSQFLSSRKRPLSLFLFLMVLPAISSIPQRKPYITFGIFIGKIEEGARIFTPVRLLPYEHPEAGGHDFPTAKRFHQKEYEVLVLLGEKVGLKLKATLQRYPTAPVAEWWYPEFLIPPVEEVKSAEVKIVNSRKSPIPGLRVVAFKEGFPLCFIVDTRGLSLEERRMKWATTSGLDITRQQFLQGLAEISSWFPPDGSWIVVFKPQR